MSATFPQPSPSPGFGAVSGALPPPNLGFAQAPSAAPLLRVASPAMLEQRDRDEEARRLAATKPLNDQQRTGLAAYVRRIFERMRNHRQSGGGWNERLLRAQRQWNGEYDPETERDIAAFGGSKVFARIVSTKCRGAAAMLREVYLTGQRPWGIAPTPFPTLPDDITNAVDQLIEAEIANMAMNDQEVPEGLAVERKQSLLADAQKASREKAREESANAERRLDDLLVEGNFYSALAEFLHDITLYPFAVLKGPVVRMAPKVKWVNKRAVIENVPKMFWARVSPFDIWFTPGAGDIAQADIVERLRLTRADLNALLDVPGYDSKAITAVLGMFGERGFVENMLDSTDIQRADSESRENPTLNDSGMFDVLEFHGSVQGRMLIDAGMPASKIKNPARDYNVQLWMVADQVIKVQMAPSPRKRHPYYVTSFEKVPGTIVGNAVPDIISDIQDVCNAILRALVNNMSMASGPQVVVNTDLLADEENGDELYPWKRWRVVNPRTGGSQKAVEFFQPNSNIQELLVAYEKLTQVADELSAIPRYLTGSGNNGGGAGRTASGLAMLMNNASKVLQTVAANIDRDIFAPMLQALYDILMLTDSDPAMPGALRGDESIEVKGVAVAVQRETERQRQIELLQATANPMDMEIMGLGGRAKLLRMVSRGVGLDGETLVPSDDELAAKERAQKAAALAGGGLPPDAGAPGAGGGGAGAGAGEGAPAPAAPRSARPPSIPQGGPGTPGAAPAAMPAANPRGAVSAQLGRMAQGMQRGGEQTRPRATGPRVNLQQQRPMAA